MFLAVYFIAGVLFLKFARGAQGKEMVPNYEFWAALPGLIKVTAKLLTSYVLCRATDTVCYFYL